MEIKDFEKAADLVKHIRQLRVIKQNDKNNPKKYRERITLDTTHLKDEIFKMLDDKIEELEKELKEL